MTFIISALPCLLLASSITIAFTKDLYVSLDCWREDANNPAIPTILEGKDRNLRENYKVRKEAIDMCHRAAKARGLTMFALRNGGQCLGVSEKDNYRKYGKVNWCVDGKGSAKANNVYKIEHPCDINNGGCSDICTKVTDGKGECGCKLGRKVTEKDPNLCEPVCVDDTRMLSADICADKEAYGGCDGIYKTYFDIACKKTCGKC